MKKINFYIIFLILSIFLIYPSFVLAENSFYVDSKAKSDGDGSKEKPFQKINEAIKKGGKEIYIKNGNYTENINLEKNVKIKGENKEKTIIIGEIKMGNDSLIENLTVKSGGVFIGNGISSSINKSTIKNCSIGITTEGSGKLKVSGCEITGNTKGFYIQKGKEIEIRSSIITNNGGEGIDIRNNVDGIIANNTIKNNSEGGIEVIAGGSNLNISENNIQNNKASGIAIQYYSIANKFGALKIQNNSISGNGNFGIVCKNPSGGGSYSSDYWSKSVEMGANNISTNKEGSFSKDCKFSADLQNNATKTPEEIALEKAKLEEEIKKKELEEKTKLEEEKRLEEELLAKNLENEKIEKEKEIKNSLENLKTNFEKETIESEKLKKEIEERYKIKIFFIGVDYKKLNELAEKNSVFEEEKKELEKIKEITENEETKKLIQENITKIKEKQEIYQKFVKQELNKFSLLVWFFEFFNFS